MCSKNKTQSCEKEVMIKTRWGGEIDAQFNQILDSIPRLIA